MNTVTSKKQKMKLKKNPFGITNTGNFLMPRETRSSPINYEQMCSKQTDMKKIDSIQKIKFALSNLDTMSLFHHFEKDIGKISEK